MTPLETTEELVDAKANGKKAKAPEPVSLAKTNEIDPKKIKALEMTLGNIEKQFGKGSVVRLGQSTRLNVDAISTGSIALDMALGVGGIPRGRITEIYGTESSGKNDHRIAGHRPRAEKRRRVRLCGRGTRD